MQIVTDYLVIGSGVAGLSFALEASRNGDVLIVTKRSADESNTKYAQGGIAAVLGEGREHLHEVRRAGRAVMEEDRLAGRLAERGHLKGPSVGEVEE